MLPEYHPWYHPSRKNNLNMPKYILQQSNFIFFHYFQFSLKTSFLKQLQRQTQILILHLSFTKKNKIQNLK